MSKRNETDVIKRLRKQVILLKQKEEKSKEKLRQALLKIRHLGKFYKSKLLKQSKKIKAKVKATEITVAKKIKKSALSAKKKKRTKGRLD